MSISLSQPADFVAALKLRLNDANKVVLKGYLVLLGTLMQTMGKELKVYR